MKYFILALAGCFTIPGLFAQTYAGKLIDLASGMPIPFANIGIIDQNIGTVTDTAGMFQIELDSEFNGDTIRISCIGYEHKEFAVRRFREMIGKNTLGTIGLAPKTYQLEEIVFRAGKFTTLNLGNDCPPNSTYGNAFYSNQLGTEIGIIINLPRKKKMSTLKQFRFYVGEFTFSNFPVRLNIYNLQDGLPHENILRSPIFHEITSAGEYILDLEPYEIHLEEDFFIGLEYYRIADQSEGSLVFCATFGRKKQKVKTYYRLTSQGIWEVEQFAKIGFSVQLELDQQ